MTFLAQIALDELPAEAQGRGLPEEGYLAFFLGLSDHAGGSAVRHLIGPNPARMPTVPRKLPPLFGGDLTYYRPDATCRTLAPTRFVRWPIRFATYEDGTLSAAERRYNARMDPSDLARFPVRPELIRRVMRVMEKALDPTSVSRLDDLIEKDRVRRSKVEQELAGFRQNDPNPRISELRETLEGLARRAARFGEEQADHARRRAAMNLAKDRLPDLLSRADSVHGFAEKDQEEVSDLYRALADRKAGKNPLTGLPYQTAVPLHSIERVRRTELREFGLRNDATWGRLTEAERAFLDEDLAEDLTTPHQMFGEGTDIQGHGPGYASGELLLQVFYDEAMMWMFGDVGLVQFRLRYSDLNAGRWEAAWTEFASH